MPRKELNASSSTAQAQQVAASEGIDAYELPKSLVTRLARSALPDNAKMQKEMLLAVMKGSTVFVNYLAATAHDVASGKQHKSVSASDVLKALELMEMGDLVPKLQAELQIYRDGQKNDKGKKTGGRGRGKDAESISAVSSKAKGKERATITIPSRVSAAAPSISTSAHILAPTTPEPEEDDDEEPESGQGRVVEEDEEMMDAEPYDDEGDLVDDIDEGDEDEGDEGDEGEEVVDEMAVEEEEIRRDARGVEERDKYIDDDA
ncbi:hypothetical protein PHLCEN_2v9727 [Hermanssonia centrifuga]|uniref:DNA polymerase epsilon subunit D n=1 Tax=Hermanssonia centrifuga TaxID=98765 RepID=A0A2R6NPV2_9APHY|nr:hypothetical protein PHLCEN_2v9727 [Hermanssonia centrifuga]